MNHFAAIRKDFTRTFLLALLAFFLIPALTLLFVHYGEGKLDNDYTAIITQQAQSAGENMDQMQALLQATPPSSACDTSDPSLVDYREGVCAPYSELWQFHIVGKLAGATLIGSVAVLLATLALGVLAFRNRRMQQLSLTVAKRLLMLACAVEVVLQGAMAVWLSFWLTAFFTERYYPKLIILIGLMVGAGVFYAVTGIFKKPPQNNELEGELLGSDAAPDLWARIDELAQRLGTQPPDHIVAGIDVNFFVTEAPLTVNGQHLRGRTLFVSIPLLRQLSTAEADGVLTHELTHLAGGDTASSAMLGPQLVQYDQYLAMMYANFITRVVFYPLCLYRMLFELARQRDSREREYIADRAAAGSVSPQAIVQSLIKISAYAEYRTQIEQALFARNQQHDGALAIAASVAAGLHDYAHSEGFIEAMRSGNVPHPFDSHPALIERMGNVGHQINEAQYAGIVTLAPQQTWVDGMPTADAIEQRLWARYEQHFAEEHEQSLAWRYEPANDEETAVVLKYFPLLNFALKRGKSVQISYAGLTPPGVTEMISWDRVQKVEYNDGFGADVLTITHPEKGLLKHKTSKIKLPGIKKQRGQFKEAFGRYWQRHQIMRAQQQSTVEADS